MDEKAARPLLVVGAPRSGTTLVGSYLGSSKNVLDLGEYGGFYAAHLIVPSVIGKFPGLYRDAYLEDLCNHARDFAEDAAREAGRGWYCDATPWNLGCARTLAAQLPDALFVLTIRHYAGTVQSLRRSFAAGFQWAGASFEESARLWATMYAHVAELPPERTVSFAYDALGARPEETLRKLEADLAAHGFDSSGLDREVLAVSHASVPGQRPTVGVREPGGVRLVPFPTVELEHWSGDIQAAVWPAVREVHLDLQRRFPEVYVTPPPPRGLHRHDEIRGLVPLELEGW